MTTEGSVTSTGMADKLSEDKVRRLRTVIDEHLKDNDVYSQIRKY
jgi:hypothetical protein